MAQLALVLSHAVQNTTINLCLNKLSRLHSTFVYGSYLQFSFATVSPIDLGNLELVVLPLHETIIFSFYSFSPSQYDAFLPTNQESATSRELFRV